MKQIILPVIFLWTVMYGRAWAQAPQLQLNLQPGQTYTAAMVQSTQQLAANRIPYKVLYDRVVGWAGLDFWQSGDTTAKAHLVQSWWDLENSHINAPRTAL